MGLALIGLVVAPMPAYAQMIEPGPASVADIAEGLLDAVVNISTRQNVDSDDRGPRMKAPEGSPFQDFFDDFFDGDKQGPRSRRVSSLGSGFVIDPDGTVVTNNHVIEGADDIEVIFADGSKLKAELVGADTKTDLAVLKVNPPAPLKAVPFGDSETMRIGDWVMAIGNPFGLGGSVTVGIISARGRDIQSGPYDNFIQTDAAINRGNSGGPLFNMKGEVIGINTAIISPSGGSIGIGFAVPTEMAVSVIDQLREFGETRRGWLGVRIQDVTEDMAEALGLASTEGAMVSDVPEGPAMEAGMKAGDVIVSFDGREVQDTRQLVRIVGNTEVGKSVRVVVNRNGTTETLKVTLGRREEAERTYPASQEMTPDEPAESELMGLTLSPLTQELRDEMGLQSSATGLAVTGVDETSEAFEKGLRAGDIITEAGQAEVLSISELETKIEEAKEAGRKSILLLVRRGGDPRFVALSLDASE